MTQPGLCPAATAQMGSACIVSTREAPEQSTPRGQELPDGLFVLWFTAGNGFRGKMLVRLMV